MMLKGKKKFEPIPVPEPPKVDLRPGCLSCKFLIGAQCRRNPPKVHVTGDSVWPRVSASDWCGEWISK
jgi:hypothetical protein